MSIVHVIRYLAARVTDNERGATAVEYGLMVALIAVAIILTVTALGQGLDGLFGEVNDRLPAVPLEGGGE
ncbi:MAG TPA: Flp family type IVb pilin [Egibacteraceae bacterium]|nr:Flp family type IVb pilin [Egibacteraceae bacterium]